MIDSTRKRLEAIIAILDGPIHYPDDIFKDPVQTLEDLRQISTICKNALHEDPVLDHVKLREAVDYTNIQDLLDFFRDLSTLEKRTGVKLPVKITVEVDLPLEFTEAAGK